MLSDVLSLFYELKVLLWVKVIELLLLLFEVRSGIFVLNVEVLFGIGIL